MTRANRHLLPGYVWHITHRCHKREFLLKFDIEEVLKVLLTDGMKNGHKASQWVIKNL